MKWLNEPASWQRTGDVLSVSVDPGTDFWRETGYGYIHDSGHVYGEEHEGDVDVTVCVRGAFGSQYDQAGIMLRIEERVWLKTGVEFFEGRPRLSTVLTLGRSSWMVTDLPDWMEEITLRASRRGDAVEVRYLVAGGPPELAALVYLPPGRAVLAGIMCAAPEGPGFRVSFSDLLIERGWSARLARMAAERRDEAVAEQHDEADTEQHDEPVTEQLGEAAAGWRDEAVTEQLGEAAAGWPGEADTERPGEADTERPGEAAAGWPGEAARGRPTMMWARPGNRAKRTPLAGPLPRHQKRIRTGRVSRLGTAPLTGRSRCRRIPIRDGPTFRAKAMARAGSGKPALIRRHGGPAVPVTRPKRGGSVKSHRTHQPPGIPPGRGMTRHRHRPASPLTHWGRRGRVSRSTLRGRCGRVSCASTPAGCHRMSRSAIRGRCGRVSCGWTPARCGQEPRRTTRRGPRPLNRTRAQQRKRPASPAMTWSRCRRVSHGMIRGRCRRVSHGMIRGRCHWMNPRQIRARCPRVNPRVRINSLSLRPNQAGCRRTCPGSPAMTSR